MVLYYFNGNIIGRGSGRSATGAAAYRSGGILRSAAYRSGEELRDETGEIVHDYTRKSGVVYSEIMLPDGAPPEYVDREILWNAVEASEKRKDSQLAREIVVALQREFDLQERIEVLREYIAENFTEKGMIADLNIHDKGDDNPHAHIMLTTRHVSPDGFGLKNRDWNKKDMLLDWRESWTEVNNRKFEQKGLDERIDHRSYKAKLAP
ncbi:MAG: MobA/MobL family protein [Nitrososphaerota archaeon]|jgi:ATP-dependent exoDNAse (exonuclease V) alpha subunit|nr:MobA/MobL family protein [Nitrososphaerota archaeon]